MAEKSVKKKPNILVRMGRGIVRFFRDTRGELKKVVWPSRKQVLNNFLVVVVFVVLAAVFIFLLDLLFNWLLNLLINLGTAL
ncbi:MAG: preprotein translocase subunit SecE [Ruminococcaceae bacterium]|nr:preprotein translocase subunit SecE [Oscillospiraceae bacterium]